MTTPENTKVRFIIGNPPFSGSEGELSTLLKRIRVSYGRLSKLDNKIEYCRVWSKAAAEPECLLIVGPSGVGKTSLIENYISKHAPSQTISGTTVPVLYTEIPVSATMKDMASALLGALGDPLADKGTLNSKTLRLERLMSECKVELMILDEFQHFIDRESEKVLRSVSDWLKNLINRTKTPIVLVGMPESIRVLTSNDQLARRFSAQEKLTPFRWDGRYKEEFCKFLEFVAERLPYPTDPPIYSPEVAQRLFWATEGRAGLVMKILRAACIATFTEVTVTPKTVTLPHLAKAYEDKLGAIDPYEANPFEGPVPEIDSWGRPYRPALAKREAEEHAARQAAKVARKHKPTPIEKTLENRLPA